MRWLVALVAAGCGDLHLFVERTWPADFSAVVLISDENDVPLAPPEVLLPDEPMVLLSTGAPRFRLHVFTFAPPPVGPDLSACEVSYEGGAPLPPPELVLSSPLVAPGDAIALAEVPPPPLDLHLEGCDDRCPTITTRQLGPLPGRVRRVAAVTPELAFFAGDQYSEDDERTRIGRIDRGEAALLPPVEGITEEALALIWDRDGSAFGTTEGGSFFQIRLDTSIRALSPPAPFVDLTAGIDAEMFARDLDGRVWRFVAGSTVAELQPNTGFNAIHIHAVRKDRVAATTTVGTLQFFDGYEWREERGALATFNDLTGDETLFAAAGDLGPFAVRIGDRPAWQEIERPFVERPLGVATVGSGRLIAVGEAGSAALWTGQRWCPFDTGNTTHLADVDVAPGGRIAWAVGEAADRYPILEITIGD